MQSTRQYSIGSVEVALELLEAFCEEDGELCITHLAQRLSISKSRVFRLLATFEQKGYVKKSALQGKYDIGISAFETSRKLLTRMELLNKAKPVMDEFVRECPESIYLAVPVDQDILFIEMVSTSQQVQTIPFVGRRYPVMEVAAGVVVSSSTGSNGKLPAEGGRTRAEGVCIDQDKLAEGITSIAAPIFDRNARVIGSLCLIGPSFRLTTTKTRDFHISCLEQAASRISAKLGYQI